MKALLVVDIQKGLTCKKGFYNETQFFETVNGAIDHFRDHNFPIIYIQHNSNMLLEGTEAWEIDDRVTRTSTNKIIQKKHGNSFQETELRSVLERFNTNEIIVCGLATNQCIKATCLGGVKNGFRVFILENGHSNWTENAEETVCLTEKKLQENGVHIVDLHYLKSSLM